MTKKPMKQEYKTFLKFLTGVFVLVLGVAFILVWWDDVAVLFRGTLGFAMALGGLLLLYSIRK